MNADLATRLGNANPQLPRCGRAGVGGRRGTPWQGREAETSGLGGIPRGNAPPSNLGDVCAIFTRDEIADWFREWEATLVATVNKAVEEAKRTREAESPLPPENDPDRDVER